MIKSQWTALLAAGILTTTLCVCGAGEPSPAGKSAPEKKSIAVLDVNSIFKNNSRFKAKKDDIETDMKFAQAKWKQENDEIAKDAERLKELSGGSEEQRRLEQDLLKRRSSLQYDVTVQKQEFVRREAKVYWETYQELLPRVAEYAKTHKIAAVLNADRQSVNPDKPEDVIRVMSRPFVWIVDDLDITPAIAKMLEDKKPAEKPKAREPEPTKKPVQQKADIKKAKEKKPADKKDTEKVPEDKVPVPAPPSRSTTNVGGLAQVTVLSPISLAAEKLSAKPTEKSEAKPEPKPAEKPADKQEAKPETKPAEKAEPKPQPKTEKPADKPTDKPAEKPTDKKKATVVRLAIRGDYTEGPSQPGLFGDMQPTLAKVIERLEEAAADKAVSAIWLRIEEVGLGRGKIHELREAIARARKTGKRVYAELTSADTGAYLLASACDEVFMPPSGTLLLPGVRAETMFYKGLLDKVGLQFDALQMGKFKGAAEPMTRNSMSGPLRESMEAIVNDLYADLLGTIAKDRRMKEYLVGLLVDQGLFTATKAQQAGLIDHVAYADQFEETLRKKLGVEKLDVNAAYKKKQVETDFSGLSGMMKLMEMLAGGKTAEKAGAKQRIAVVYAVGPIVEGKSATDFLGESSIGSTSMVEAIRKAGEDPKVVAVVLRVDSPGGSATASDLIWRETKRLKKPFIVSMGDVAGSGGYYIAMGAKKIYAEPGTITGSIGVIGGKLVTRGLYEKLGLNTEVISRGRNSGALSSNQPFTPEERKAWTELLEETYDQFISKAAEGRKMDKNRLAELAQGRVYTGRMAKKLGLIDEIGTLQDAIAEAKKAAGLKPDADVDLLILPKPRSLFEQLFGDSSITTDLESAAPEVVGTLRQAKLWRQLLNERALMWMPYGVRIR